jgi:hypothetical protein
VHSPGRRLGFGSLKALRVPISKMKTHWLILRSDRLAALFLGTLFGLTLAMSITGKRLEDLTVINRRLETELVEAKENLEKLHLSLSKKRYSVVQRFELVLEGQVEFCREELEEALRKKLQVLVGKDLNTLDPEIVLELFRGVKIMAGEETFSVEPIQIVLAKNAYFRIFVSPVSPSIPGLE